MDGIPALLGDKSPINPPCILSLPAEQVKGEDNAALARLRLLQAFEHERQTVRLVASDTALEPTRSVLHRSAATLALECSALRDAERLIAVARSDDPPPKLLKNFAICSNKSVLAARKGRRRFKPLDYVAGLRGGHGGAGTEGIVGVGG